MRFKECSTRYWRLTEKVGRALAPFFDRAWPSYLLIAALQTKVLWGIWAYRDMTGGDTSSYFVSAREWAESLSVDIVWSPLYTAFFGTFYLLTNDAYLATILHRAAIVMAATIGVLTLMRQLVGPAIAIAVAAWWASLPINFETMYEVHLFSLLPVLAAWLVAGRFDSLFGRGAVLAIFAASSILVRNELLVATLIYAAVCFVREVRSIGRGGPVFLAVAKRGMGYALPMLVAASVVGFFYSHSSVTGGNLSPHAKAKHTLNMCQVYAFGYAQRNPEWTNSPWTECQGLMKDTFGQDQPTLGEMIASNPKAIMHHFLWNISLAPAGLQLALFNSISGSVTPDYAPAPITENLLPLILSLVVFVLIGCGVAEVVRNARYWWEKYFHSRAGLWFAMASVALVAGPVILTQRPRPSYLFALTIFVMAILASAAHVLTAHWPTWRKAAGAVPWIVLFALMPPYYMVKSSDRPLRSAYVALRPFADLLSGVNGKVVFGDFAFSVSTYVTGKTLPGGVYDYTILNEREPTQKLAEFLESEGVDALFVQPRVFEELHSLPGADGLFSQPEELGWRKYTSDAMDGKKWLLLVKGELM